MSITLKRGSLTPFTHEGTEYLLRYLGNIARSPYRDYVVIVHEVGNTSGRFAQARAPRRSMLTPDYIGTRIADAVARYARQA
jgi:hypothetical protein